MADVKVDITVNDPKIIKFKLAGKTLRDARKNLDAREEWGLYDATKNQKGGTTLDKAGKVTSVKIQLNPIIQLPDWNGYRSATKEQKASWDKMIKALEVHERKHHKIQIDCASELEDAIEQAKALDAKGLKKMISDQQKACQKKQDDYDTKSNHGEKEGVKLDLDE